MITKRRSIRIAVLVLALSALGMAQTPTSLALSHFTARGVPADDADLVADRISSHLINSEHISVMERSRVEEILKEQGFQQTGVCDETSCAMEMGQLLGVEKMAVGTVGKIGKIYTVSSASLTSAPLVWNSRCRKTANAA